MKKAVNVSIPILNIIVIKTFSIPLILLTSRKLSIELLLASHLGSRIY
jgi:hypothetical protein